MKSLVVAVLTWAAKRVLLLNKPVVIAVTGSVGKTSTKDAITAVLSVRYAVRAGSKNLNTEIGVPLSILGMQNPSRNFYRWGQVLANAVGMAIRRDQQFPTHLVLEFGADRPGDITHLMKLAQPSVGVVTAISHVHVENFPSFEALVAEKTELVKHLPADGLAVLNADDELVTQMASAGEAAVVTYGFGPDAEIDGQGYQLQTREDDHFEAGETLACASFTVHDRRMDERADVVLKDTIGIHQAYNCLAAIAVGKRFGISLPEAARALSEQYVSPSGRLKPLRGIKGALLLDDSYNAAPTSTKSALDVLAQFHPVEAARRIACLGTHAELGSFSEEMHRQIGWKAAEVGVDLLVCVGEPARDIARGAEEAGMKKEQVLTFDTTDEAGAYLDKEIATGDIVLIKGSQSARMERVTKNVLADPLRASELLVRQEPEWEARS